METVDSVVIGAGAVGLACARALAMAGREVLVLEAEGQFGTGISSRNSEVIHAGLYSPPGSLKARLCLEGRDALYDYCARQGVAHRRCGKLVVAATPAQAARRMVFSFIAFSPPCPCRAGMGLVRAASAAVTGLSRPAGVSRQRRWRLRGHPPRR